MPRAGLSTSESPARLFFLAALALAAPSLRAFAAEEAGAGALETLRREARELGLARDPQWLRLLHHGRDVLGRSRSSVDDPAFFLSSLGRRDPAAELEATLEAFFAPGPRAEGLQHPQCAFPARFAWLDDRLGFGGRLEKRPCERFEAWRSQMDPGSVTLIFASAYLNNPASMYGHTFLRLDRRGRGPQERLLDYTLNYYAEADTRNGLVFAWKSIVGGFAGAFSTLPYYMKVQEYNNIESRDIWEYELSLSSAARDRLVRHLWELGPSRPTYYFANKNCAYQLLPILDAAEPSLDLARWFRWKAIPVDTLRAAVREPGLLAAKRWRPSHLSVMLDRRSRLSDEERLLAERLAAGSPEEASAALDALPAARRAAALDSAYDLFRYREGFRPTLPPGAAERDAALLSLRNRLAPAGPEGGPPPAAPPSPELGHGSGRAGLGWGWTRRGGFAELSVRGALHDPVDPPEGYLPGSKLEMAALVVRAEPGRGAAYLDRLTLVDIVSLSAWDAWAPKLSWKINLGLGSLRDLDLPPERSFAFGLNAGAGASAASALWRGERVYGLAEVDLAAGRGLQRGHRLGAGASTGALVELARGWRVQLEAGWLRYVSGDTGGPIRLSLVSSWSLARDLGLRAALENRGGNEEARLSALVYF